VVSENARETGGARRGMPMNSRILQVLIGGWIAADYPVRVGAIFGIFEAEEELRLAVLNDPGIVSDGPRHIEAGARLMTAQNQVDQRYSSWAELDEKRSR